ncbi:PDDEXK family nuclease [Streptomyces erythrochromogenes]|uniref:hypothetical protein n=1 Tax=Streptomyces erythrochromogenes TaxID=285574 RepID=UPI0036A7C021
MHGQGGRRDHFGERPPALTARPVRGHVGVVSPSSVRNDYEAHEVKDRAYARRGIPHYLILDPYKAHRVTLGNPGPGGYRGRDTIPYGGEVKVETGIGKLVIDTSGLPVDPADVRP